MTKYLVETEWSGYSRGISSYEVEADNPEEAEELWYEGKMIHNITVRDDRENDVTCVEEIIND